MFKVKTINEEILMVFIQKHRTKTRYSTNMCSVFFPTTFYFSMSFLKISITLTLWRNIKIRILLHYFILLLIVAFVLCLVLLNKQNPPLYIPYIVIHYNSVVNETIDT